MKKRALLSLLLAPVLAVSLALPAGTAYATDSPRLRQWPVDAAPDRMDMPLISVNDFHWEPESPAWAESGVTMVPAEELLDTLGSPSFYALGQYHPDINYRWAEDGSNALTVEWRDHTLTITPGADTMAVDGGEVALPRPAHFEIRTLYVPLRAVCEALGLHVHWAGNTAISVEWEKNRVAVDNLTDFYNAIAPDTQIELKPGNYSVADVDPADIHNPYVEVSYDLFDRETGEWGTGTQWEFIIHDVRDLLITGNVDSWNTGAEFTTLSTPWAYADVLSFRDCHRVELWQLTAVHDVEPGYCVGDCLQLEGCDGVGVHRCTLDGSGAYGLNAWKSRNITLEKCQITHCTYGAMALDEVENVGLSQTFVEECRDCFHLFSLWDTNDLWVIDCDFGGNSAGSLVSSGGRTRNIVFERCTFGDNAFGQVLNYEWAQSGGAVFLDCRGLD